MTTLLTPFDLTAATRTGKNVFRKQVLRKGTINYKGQQVNFDDDFLLSVVRSFRKGAYDQVPFVFADPSNRHNMDPERYRGEVKALELTPDGVDMIVEATNEGAKVIRDNPRLGVSARIVQGLEKSDGRKFRAAVQHVLATMDPRLTGMREWEAVDLSDEDDEDDDIIDLTAATEKKGTKVATKTKAKRAAASRKDDEGVRLDLSRLSDEQFAELLLTASIPDDADEDSEDEEDEDDLEDDADVVDEDDSDDEEDEDDSDDEDEEDEEDEGEKPVAKSKSKKVKEKVSLSNPVRQTRKPKGRRGLELLLAEQRWETKREKLEAKGVPPYLLDLAEPVMKTPDRLIIDLSETGEDDVDAKKVIASMLEAAQGTIDLTAELGHTVTGVERDKDGNSTNSLLTQWESEYGKP